VSIQEICTVAENTRLQPDICLMVLDAPDIAQNARCGQFLHIACGEGNLLRRPISICTWQEDYIRIVFQIKGSGTQWLRDRKRGDQLDILGPLGNGFSLPELGQRPIFVGGGIGVPPLLACAQSAAGHGAIPRVLLGFRNSGSVILEEEFQNVCQTFVTTDDGSYARRGFVTDILREQIADATGLAACGPRPMLQAVAALAEQNRMPCQVSMEERMGCGIGACLVCACALKDKNGAVQYGHVCKDGPVFPAEEVVW